MVKVQIGVIREGGIIAKNDKVICGGIKDLRLGVLFPFAWHRLHLYELELRGWVCDVDFKDI